MTYVTGMRENDNMYDVRSMRGLSVSDHVIVI